jgi:hypothetical protein
VPDDLEGVAVNDGVSPADAVDVDDVEGATATHAAAEGADPSSTSGLGSQQSLQEMLFSTEPSPPLDQVETPWDPEVGGRTRIMRAAQKALGADGLPAIVDATIGVLEEFSRIQAEEVGDSDQADQESDESSTSEPAALSDLDVEGVP